MKNDAQLKRLSEVHEGPPMHWVGDGFPVRSIFDYNGLGRELSPFLLLDYAAPYDFPPSSRRRGVGEHPHKGFETITVVYQGEVEHRDSSGGGGKIGPGDVQWMTAGRGIVHEEFHSKEFTATGGTMQMVQLWVNLRARDKGADPAYQTLLKSDIPVVPLPGDGGTLRVIAGEFAGVRGAARTFSPIHLWDVNLAPGKTAELPVPDGYTAAILVLSGSVHAGGREAFGEGSLAVFGRSGEGIAVETDSGVKLLVLGGEPFDEPIVGYGPFVMNSRAEIQQAFEDFQSGRMGKLGS